MWTSNLNVAIERNWYKALCFFLFSECRGMHRLNTSEVSPCGEASSRWWSEPCALCVNAVVVWIVIAGLCVKLAQGRDRNSPPLTTRSHSYRADANFHVSITPHMQHNGKKQLRLTVSLKNKKPCTLGCMHLCPKCLPVSLNYWVFHHPGL